MNPSRIRGPVDAITEAEATGETAAVFTDIRETMELPLITAIWRMLADIPTGLSSSWTAVRPLYKTGQIQAAQKRMITSVALPVPKPVTTQTLNEAGVSTTDLAQIRSVLQAYNRSNALNLISLIALTTSPAGSSPDDPTPSSPPEWPTLPKLLSQAEIPSETWQLLTEFPQLGSVAKKPSVATVWRHLAHWPRLLELIFTSMKPLAAEGSVKESMRQIQAFAQTEGARIANLRSDSICIPGPARELVVSYTQKVHHIVAIGHGVERWLASAHTS